MTSILNPNYNTNIVIWPLFQQPVLIVVYAHSPGFAQEIMLKTPLVLNRF